MSVKPEPSPHTSSRDLIVREMASNIPPKLGGSPIAIRYANRGPFECFHEIAGDTFANHVHDAKIAGRFVIASTGGFLKPILRSFEIPVHALAIVVIMSKIIEALG